ncbi:uncharacterized protein IL334_002335 [Kwoniella shivajii]|uniref:LIM zinc-binding domain-containing protein n=1 Tax=Kwoniella shivajii TaxID=564305 RepID=A0ABZ1CUG6_9TREE|nr:hypothetical protein IL334_002335 [Kwoniella shivajii]
MQHNDNITRSGSATYGYQCSVDPSSSNPTRSIEYRQMQSAQQYTSDFYPQTTQANGSNPPYSSYSSNFHVAQPIYQPRYYTDQSPSSNASSSQFAPSYRSPASTVEAVPPPTPKAAYEPPVFQTFQERRRAKDLALRAKVGETSGSPSHSAVYTPPISAYPPSQPPSHLSRSPSPMSRPSPSTVAMMGQIPSSGGPPPAPPSRTRTPAPLPYTSPSPTNSHPQHINSQARPLPAPRVLPHFPPAAPISTLSRSETTSPFTPIHDNMGPPALPSPIQANLERSDTISSVKSLDRMTFGSSPIKRSLPKPPVGVNSSKSLDRGIPVGIAMGNIAGDGSRKADSRINEELANSLAGIAIQVNRSPSPATPHIKTPSPALSPSSQLPSIVIPDQPVDSRAPAKYTPSPIINVPDSDTSSTTTIDDERDIQSMNQASPKVKKPSPALTSPAIQISGLPMISVSSSDTAYESAENGGFSFAVPTINVGDSTTVINVPPVSAPSVSPSPSLPRQTRVRPEGSAILCTGCDNAIIGRIVNAMNQRWHPQCFMCAECGELLEHVSSYEWEGKAYCHLDFHDKFAHKCHHCQTPIVDSRFVTLNDPVLGQRYYHELHFFCSECGDPFLDPSKSSAPGNENFGNGDAEEDEGETSAFVIQKGHPYCERCHLRLHKPRCKACSQPIPDLAVNAMGAKWHQECFVCVQCHNEFANNLFFPKDGSAFCTSCYEIMVASG